MTFTLRYLPKEINSRSFHFPMFYTLSAVDTYLLSCLFCSSPSVVVARRHRPHHRSRPHNVHVQSNPVQPAGIQLSSGSVARGRAALDLRAAADAEEQAGAAEPARYGVPRAALDVPLAAAVRGLF